MNQSNINYTTPLLFNNSEISELSSDTNSKAYKQDNSSKNNDESKNITGYMNHLQAVQTVASSIVNQSFSRFS